MSFRPSLSGFSAPTRRPSPAEQTILGACSRERFLTAQEIAGSLGVPCTPKLRAALNRLARDGYLFRPMFGRPGSRMGYRVARCR